MGNRADKMLPVYEDTKQVLDERKPDGWTYDYWVRRQLGITNDD